MKSLCSSWLNLKKNSIKESGRKWVSSLNKFNCISFIKRIMKTTWDERVPFLLLLFLINSSFSVNHISLLDVSFTNTCKTFDWERTLAGEVFYLLHERKFTNLPYEGQGNGKWSITENITCITKNFTFNLATSLRKGKSHKEGIRPLPLFLWIDKTDWMLTNGDLYDSI